MADISPMPNGMYVAIISPSQARDIQEYPSYEEVVAWAVEDGEMPPSRAEYEADKEASAKLLGKLGTYRGVSIIKDG